MEELGRLPSEEARHAAKRPILLILDDVRSMHNVGSAFRTADAFGIAGIYLCGYTPTPPHRDIRKTALGAEDTVMWQHFETTTAAVEAARSNGYTIIAIEQAHNSILLADYRRSEDKPIALVFGNEVAGVSDAVLDIADACIEIPQYGAKHSLNVSVSMGVVLWELVRHNNPQPLL